MRSISDKNASIIPIEIQKAPLLWLDETIIMNETINPIMGIIANS